jgi:alkaline phosphatase
LLIGVCLALLGAGCLASVGPAAAPPRETARGAGGPGGAAAPRSAVLFIADGLGPAYVTATRIARGGDDGMLHMDAMPYTAILRTYAADDPVTDSAAAATAMACGRKTVNGALGQDATAIYAKRPGRTLESIAVWAARRGMAVGIISTARVTHATPAAFYASQNDRDLEEAIALQALDADLDFLLGGGRARFRSALRVGAEDLEESLAGRGWRLVTDSAGLRAADAAPGRMLGLFADSHMPYEPERLQMATGKDGGAVPSLAEMTTWGIDRLKKEGAGFLLVVEGGRPDHAGHENWARTLVDEVAAFDEAIGATLARVDAASTLVLATGDHETGGLAINSGKSGATVLTFATGPGTKQQADRAPYGAEDPAPSLIHEEHAGHSAVDVPLYAWGAGSDAVHGTLENTAVYFLLRAHFEGKPAARESLVQPGR